MTDQKPADVRNCVITTLRAEIARRQALQTAKAAGAITKPRPFMALLDGKPKGKT